MSRKEYKQDEALKRDRMKELGSLEYQCRTCKRKGCGFLKCARTHFEACKDYLRDNGEKILKK